MFDAKQDIVQLTRAPLNYFRNSAPFLSGDLFADKADVAVYSPKWRGKQPSLKMLSRANVIFCKSNKVEQFLSEYKSNIHAKVLIFGNSDEDFEGFDFILPNSVRMVFAQNLQFNDSKFRTLPIGIENIRYSNNGIPKLFTLKYIHKKKSNRILVGPFRKTHLERHELDFASVVAGPWDYQSSRLTPVEYACYSSQFKFIAAPRGNGIDTHRFWETMYRGGIPVVKRNLWSQSLKYLDVPFIEISDWEEGLLKALVKVNSTKMIQPSTIKDLWWPSWEQRIKSYL